MMSHTRASAPLLLAPLAGLRHLMQGPQSANARGSPVPSPSPEAGGAGRGGLGRNVTGGSFLNNTLAGIGNATRGAGRKGPIAALGGAALHLMLGHACCDA